MQFEQAVCVAAGLGIEAQRLRGLLGVERRLADRREAPLAQHIGADHQPLRLEVVQPFRGFVLTGVVGHGALQFVAGQR
jgi:hypothetical protein